MKLVGKEFLENNSYSSIYVSDKSVRINYGEYVDTMKQNIIEVDDKEGHEIVERIIDFFLNNGIINYYEFGLACDNYGRKLFFKDIDTHLLDKIKSKYEKDRLLNLKNSNSSIYLLNTMINMSFYTTDDYYILMENYKTLNISEIEFLKEMIEYVFNNEKALIITSGNFEDNKMDIINFDNSKTIKLGSNIVLNYMQEVCKIVSDHNNNLNHNKKRLERKY